VQFLQFLDLIFVTLVLGELFIQFFLQIFLILDEEIEEIYENFTGDIDVVAAFCNIDLI